MRRRFTMVAALAAVAVLGAARPAAAEGAGNFGLGLIIGSPTGISMKYYLGGGHAIDGAFGAAVVRNSGVHVHADYLWHPFMLAEEASFFLPVYVGVGARLLDHNRGGGNDEDDIHIGARFPAGILFDFRTVPLDVFLELALVLDFQDHGDDDLDLDLNAGIGVRYYF